MSFISNQLQKEERIINISWFDEKLVPYATFLKSVHNMKFQRNYKIYAINRDNVDAKNKFILIENDAKKIRQQDDSINGIHIIFDDDAQYWTLVKAIDICYFNDIRTFIPEDNHLWIFYVPVRKSNEITPIYID